MTALVIGTLITIAVLTFVLFPLLMSGPTPGSGASGTSRTCGECGEPADKGARFCARCGAALG